MADDIQDKWTVLKLRKTISRQDRQIKDLQRQIKQQGQPKKVADSVLGEIGRRPEFEKGGTLQSFLDDYEQMVREGIDYNSMPSDSPEKTFKLARFLFECKRRLIEKKYWVTFLSDIKVHRRTAQQLWMTWETFTNHLTKLDFVTRNGLLELVDYWKKQQAFNPMSPEQFVEHIVSESPGMGRLNSAQLRRRLLGEENQVTKRPRKPMTGTIDGIKITMLKNRKAINIKWSSEDQQLQQYLAREIERALARRPR